MTHSYRPCDDALIERERANKTPSDVIAKMIAPTLNAQALRSHATHAGLECGKKPAPPDDWWSPARVATLTELWNAGIMSTVEIGRHMGISKDMVVGKARRLKLIRKASPITRKTKADDDGDGSIWPQPPHRILPPMDPVSWDAISLENFRNLDADIKHRRR